MSERLSGYCDKYTALVGSSKGAESHAPQLELLHEIYDLLKTANPEEVKAVQPTLEKGLTGSLAQGPAQPVRRLISLCFCYAYARGARQTMYTTVGQFISWLNNKSSPASSSLAKVGVAAVLGELCEMHGNAMVSLCQDVLNLMIKNLRTVAELPLRTMSATALAAALAGSGGINKEMQGEAIKSLKAALDERRAPVELRIACLQCCPNLARYSEQLWHGDVLDQLAALLLKALDDPSAPLRAAAAAALGDACLAALEAPWRAAPRKGSAEPAPKPAATRSFKFGGSKLSGMLEQAAAPKKADANSALEAVVATLAAPFARSGATREVRAGIARAVVRLLRAMKRPALEKNAPYLLTQLLSLLDDKSGGRPLQDCVSHMVRAGLGETLSERGQLVMATALATAATAKGASEAVVLCSLKELALLLLQLREVAADARDVLMGGERPLSTLLLAPPKTVRLAACHTLWALALAFPAQLAPLLEAQLHAVASEHAKASSEKGKGAQQALDALQAHAHAAATLVCAMPETPFGCPNALSAATLNTAASLAGRGEERSAAAWLLLRALLHLEPEWMASKARLQEVLKMWGAVLGRRVDAVSKDAREQVETQLRLRAAALGCVTGFLQQMPKQALALLVKQVVGAVLPPNTELLKQCSEHAAALMSQSFRAAFMLFRARLYELLALPYSELRAAKVLNVVMPMVVGDIVDPSNTQSATCSALGAMLSADDDVLGGAGAGGAAAAERAHDAVEELDPDPMRSALIPGALGACDWLCELGSAAERQRAESAALERAAEVQALNAAVRLFAAVFQLGTSDVRQQLLGHLGNAAAKAKQGETKEQGRFMLGGGGGDKPERASGLTNLCGALLGSLQLLAARPSKSALKLDLAEAISAVLTPCLHDADAAVRRGAAQCVGLLGGLLGDGYAALFTKAAEAAVGGKAKEEAKAAYALALGWLLKGAHPSEQGGPRLKSVVRLLTPLAADGPPAVSEWALHALLSVIDAAAAHAQPHVASVLGLASAVVLADPPPTPRAALVVARLASALVGAVGASPEAAAAMQQGGKPASQLAAVMRRCGVLNAAAVGLCPSLEILRCEGCTPPCGSNPRVAAPPFACGHTRSIPAPAQGGLSSAVSSCQARCSRQRRPGCPSQVVARGRRASARAPPGPRLAHA